MDLKEKLVKLVVLEGRDLLVLSAVYNLMYAHALCPEHYEWPTFITMIGTASFRKYFFDKIIQAKTSCNL